MVVDTSAIMAILLGKPEADRFRDAILDAGGARMSVASVVEAGIVAMGRGRPGREQLFALLEKLLIEQVPVGAHHVQLALDAAGRYGRGRHRAALNFGDCFSYALARSLNEPLLFKGDDFALTDITPALIP
jgi:ribonuclease VapC